MTSQPKPQNQAGSLEFARYSMQITPVINNKATPPPQLSYNISYKAYAQKKCIEVFKYTYLFSTKALKSLQSNFSYKKIFTGKTHKNFDCYRDFPFKGNCIDDVIQLIADFVIKETTFNHTQEQSCIGSLKNRLNDSGLIHATPPSFAL